jgi:signal transduction histidine kinase
LNHDLPAARTVICFQRITIEEVANMLQLAEIQEFKRVAPADHVALSIVHDLRNPLSAISGCADPLGNTRRGTDEAYRYKCVASQ